MKTRMPGSPKCPYCGLLITGATDVETLLFERTPVTPHEGDVSICIDCGNWLEFGKDLQPKKTTREAVYAGLTVDQAAETQVAERAIHLRIRMEKVRKGTS